MEIYKDCFGDQALLSNIFINEVGTRSVLRKLLDDPKFRGNVSTREGQGIILRPFYKDLVGLIFSVIYISDHRIMQPKLPISVSILSCKFSTTSTTPEDFFSIPAFSFHSHSHYGPCMVWFALFFCRNASLYFPDDANLFS